MLELVVALLVVVVAAALLFRFVIQVVVVRDYQRGVRFRNGRLSGLLSTGTHVAIRPFSEIQLIDGRPTAVTVPRQEILTADGVAVGVTLIARYVVVDPVTAVTGDQSWLEALEAALRVGLRAAVAGRTVDDVLAARGDLGAGIAGFVASDVARIGVELLGVDVRDVTVPGELQRASVGVLAARKDAEAALERAKGESAAIRSLADTAPLLDRHPGLLELRATHRAEPGSTANGDSDSRPDPTVPAAPRSSRRPRAGSVAQPVGPPPEPLPDETETAVAPAAATGGSGTDA